jgi:acetyl/propionyl-CoA carboxylase alpha subunit
MTKLITTEKDKAEALMLLKAAIQVTILHGITSEQRAKVFAHVDWLEANLTEFTIDSRLESNEFQTKITMVYHHGAGNGSAN